MRIDQAKLHGEPEQSCQHEVVFLVRGQAGFAVGLDESGEAVVGQGWRVAEDFVENIRFLDVIEILPGPYKGSYRELLIGQQRKKLGETDQGRDPGNGPAGVFQEYLRDVF